MSFPGADFSFGKPPKGVKFICSLQTKERVPSSFWKEEIILRVETTIPFPVSDPRGLHWCQHGRKYRDTLASNNAATPSFKNHFFVLNHKICSRQTYHFYVDETLYDCVFVYTKKRKGVKRKMMFSDTLLGLRDFIILWSAYADMFLNLYSTYNWGITIAFPYVISIALAMSILCSLCMPEG